MGLDKHLTTHTRTVKKVLSVLDTAILPESDLEKYKETRDLKHVTLDDAEQPVWFYLRPVSDEEVKRVYGELSGLPEEVAGMRCFGELFRIACVRIEGLTYKNRKGKKKKVRVSFIREAGRVRKMDDATFEVVPSEIALELGEAIWRMSDSGDDQAKNS